MSVKKYKISKKRSNFSIISNDVAQGLSYCLDALGLYIYLFSLPHEWEFHKNHLRKVCNVGINKLDNLLRILAQHGLVKIAQNRDAQGKFAHFDMEVNDSDSFIINKLDETAQAVQCFLPYGENGATVNSTYKEDIEKEDIKEKKDKNICATQNIAQTRFKEFWDIYPRKKDKARAESIWSKNKLDSKADIIIKDIKNRMLNDHTWKEDQYIPYPKRYLGEELWENEITVVAINKKSEKFNAHQYAIDKVMKRIEANKKGIEQ